MSTRQDYSDAQPTGVTATRLNKRAWQRFSPGFLALAIVGFAAHPAHAQQTQLYWGDTHLHTNYSPDAFSLMTETADPDTSYRFAKGVPVIADMTRSRVQIGTPLDFLVVTDHAEFMGVIPELAQGNQELLAIEGAARWKEMLNSGRGGEVFFEMIEAANTDPSVLIPFNSESLRSTVWESVVDAAESHNEPGVFSAFVGWEWTSTPGGRNLHRIVFTPDGKDKAMQYLPYSFLDSERPRDLWTWLADTAKRLDTDFVAIAHNMNLSQDSMFPLYDEYGDPVNVEYAELRERWEPVAEVNQYKGDSETHPMLSPNDQFADFEIYEHLLDTTAEEDPEPEPGDYARTALMRGLQLENAIGQNPFKFGMTGATDSHTAFSSAEENNFLGKYAVDSTPEGGRIETVPGAVGWDAGAQGLAAVWATENTREAITAAFKRKEVYTSSGPRIRLRFFGGYGFKRHAPRSADLAAIGYKVGVPMGGDLPQPGKRHKAPSFLVHAAKDPVGANLDRLQIVKGWLNADGTVEERVYDVALSDDRTDGSVAVGSTVNLETASYTNDIGEVELVALWTDPDFDPGLRSFYYARVIEIPTPRHSLFDALALGIDPKETNHPATIQERAYSSPIWYTPDDSRAKTTEVLPLAREKAPTVDEILGKGFAQMKGADIRKLVGKKIVLRNTVSGRTFDGMLLGTGRRELTVADGSTEAEMVQGLYHGGAPVLMGDAGYEIVGDTIVSSDGLRTITSTLYTDGKKILAARDVDNGRVQFEVIVP